MLKNIIRNKIFNNLVYLLPIIIAFIFLMYKLRYAVVIYDDVLDLVINEFKFYHGRFLAEFIALVFVRGIPSLLNINIQDFAFISENILKSTILVFFTMTVTSGFFIWKKRENIYKACLFTLSFLAIYIYLMHIANALLLHTLQFFLGYILPLPLFIILWYKLASYYIENKILTSTDSKILILLALFIAQANELVCIVLFLILAIIGIEKLIKKYRYKIEENNKWVIFPFVALVLMSELVYSYPGFIEILNQYKSTEVFHFNFKSLFQYFYILFDKTIIENLLIVIPIIFAMIILLKGTENRTENKRLFLFLTYSFISFYLFFFFLFFIGKTCHYAMGNMENYEPYWLLYQPFLFSFKILLYTFGLYLFGYLLRNNENIQIKTVIFLFFIIGNFVYLKNAFPVIYKEIYSYDAKKTMYILDKFSVFYFKRGETPILPYEDLDKLFTIQENNAIMPYDLKTNSYQNKIYYNEYIGRFIWPYLIYIKKVYGINNIEKGMKFATSEEAINEYIKRGGIIAPDEFTKLDFSRIDKE